MGQRDPQDFAEFVASQWSRLVRTAVFLGCDPQEAQDLAQSTLVRCLVKWRRVSRADDIDGYVYRVLLNCFHDNKRRRWSTEQPSEAVVGTATSDSADQIAVADAVHRSLMTLETDYRVVLVLRYFVDLTQEQVAEVLDVPVGTVKSRLSRARAELANDPDLNTLVQGESG